MTIDTHYGVLFVTCKITVPLYVKTAVDQNQLLLPHGGAYSGTGEWDSKFVRFQ